MNIMTIMKKSFIKNITFIIIVVLTIIFIVIFNYNKSKNINFLIYPVNYSLCNNNVLEVEIYANKKNISFFEEISESWIEDYENNHYKIKIRNIIWEDKVLINNKNYYPFYLEVELPLVADNLENIMFAEMYISNKRGEEVCFKIGNISIVNGEYYSLVEVKSLKGETKVVEGYTTLDKISLEVYNFQNKDLYLKNILLVSGVVKVIYEEDILKPNEIKQLNLELNYLYDSFVDNVGIIITWEYCDSIYKQLINPHVLFKSSLRYNMGYEYVYEIY